MNTNRRSSRTVEGTECAIFSQQPPDDDGLPTCVVCGHPSHFAIPCVTCDHELRLIALESWAER